MRRAAQAAIALAAGALLAPACGGDDGDLSRDELISQGDVICEEYDQRTQEIPPPQSLDGVEEFVGETRTVIREDLDELKGLQPQEELADDYNQWISQSEENLGLLDELEEAAAAGDEARTQELLTDAQEAGARTDRLAADMGLKECGAND
jgi:hypothetical protein